MAPLRRVQFEDEDEEQVEARAGEKKGPESTVPDWSAIAKLQRSKIAEIARLHREVDAKLAELGKQKQVLKEAGLELMLKAGVKSVLVDDLPVTVVESSSSRLDKTSVYNAALKLGMKAAKAEQLIAMGTVRNPFTTLLVKRPKPTTAP